MFRNWRQRQSVLNGDGYLSATHRHADRKPGHCDERQLVDAYMELNQRDELHGFGRLDRREGDEWQRSDACRDFEQHIYADVLGSGWQSGSDRHGDYWQHLLDDLRCYRESAV